jgi:serine/threonine protein kinase
MPKDGSTQALERALIAGAEQEAGQLEQLRHDHATSTSLPIPDSLPGYELIREIHRGGQGVVYEAIQRSTKRTVAVKVMLDGPFASERSLWRFEREIRLVAGLRHPNIVAIHDSGVADGHNYFAMDYVRGQPLDTHVRLAVPTLRDTLQLLTPIGGGSSTAT